MQSVTFKINYSYTIIKMVSFVLTKCFKVHCIRTGTNSPEQSGFVFTAMQCVQVAEATRIRVPPS